MTKEEIKAEISLKPGARIQVIDPADKRMRVWGTIIEITETRETPTFWVTLDDDPDERYGFYQHQITKVLTWR